MCKHEENEKKTTTNNNNNNNNNKYKRNNKKHDPQVGNFFDFLDRVFTSPVILSWKESLEGEFVSNMFP